MSNKDVNIKNYLRGTLKVEPIEATGTGWSGTMFLTIPSGSSNSLSSDGLDSILFEALGEGTGTSDSPLQPDDFVFFGIDSTRVYTLSELEHNRKWKLEFRKSETEKITIPGTKDPETPKTNVTIGQPVGDEKSLMIVSLGAASLTLGAAAVSMALAPGLKELSTVAWLAVSGALALGSVVTGFLSFCKAIRNRGTSSGLTRLFKRFKK